MEGLSQARAAGATEGHKCSMAQQLHTVHRQSATSAVTGARNFCRGLQAVKAHSKNVSAASKPFPILNDTVVELPAASIAALKVKSC
jgi:hypothetical protein